MPLLSASFLRTIVWNNQIVKECEECRDMVVDAFAYQANASLAVKSNVWPRIPGKYAYINCIMVENMFSANFICKMF